jgi:DNA-binding NtrC family response regulator
VSKGTILIVDKDSITAGSLCEFLTLEGFSAVRAATIAEARNKLQARFFSLVIMDINLPDGDGFELLSFIREQCPQTVPLVITGYGTIESAVEAIKMGAYDYLTKPLVDKDLLLAVERAIRQQALLTENQQLRVQLADKYSLRRVISQDYKMTRIFELIEAVADSRTTILMTGPSGTGKSLLARSIHYRSPRRDKPFVEVSCGALPETLLESELFGYVRGAFTGAVRDKEGKFLAADGGTLFLDEISSASPALQVKLLRVLQERQFEPVGSNRTVSVDTRVILASNVNLDELVRDGKFREDLYYRINVVNIQIPRLADRPGDIPLLCRHFLGHFCRMHNRHKIDFTQSAMDCLLQYAWPGNVRELENVIERAVLLSKNSLIDTEDLPPALLESCRRIQPDSLPVRSLKKALEAPERSIIEAALEAHQWNRQETARALQINRTTLYKKMKQYGLEKKAIRLSV